MQLYLCRHGQSEGNVVTYDIPDGNLTVLGREQAEELGDCLATESLQVVISSPLRRALQTAAAVARRSGAPLEVWKDTHEHRYGEIARFAGRGQLQTLAPGALLDPALPEADWHFGEESDAAAYERVRRVLQRLRQRFGGSEVRVALVAHGAFNHYFLHAALGRPPEPSTWIEQYNACLNRLRFEPDHVRLTSVNESGHLSQIT